MNEITVSNPDSNLLISDILKDITNITDKSNIISIAKEGSEGKKGEILTAITISIISAAIYDLLRSLIKKYSSRIDFNYSLEISINNKKLTLKQIINLK